MDLDDGATWVPQMRDLEETSCDLGPVGDWQDPSTLSVVLSCAAADAGEAAQLMVDAVRSSLTRVGMGERSPVRVLVEEISADAVGALG
jgi:hypothetical protein